MITFKPTTDVDLVRDTLMSPNNLPWQFEDGFNREGLRCMKALPAGFTYVAAYCDSAYVGIFLVINKEPHVECHLALLPLAYGMSSLILYAFVEWIWANTDSELIQAPVVEDNRLAGMMAEKSGFKKAARRPHAWLKDGINHDLIVYEIVKPIIG